MGRRSKLTPELKKDILSLVAEGNYLTTACAICGITENTYYNWKKWGENAKSGKYFVFLQDVRKAEGEAEAKRLRAIKKAGEDGNWTAYAWIMERKDPDRWGKKEKLEHSGKIELEIEIDYGD